MTKKFDRVLTEKELENRREILGKFIASGMGTEYESYMGVDLKTLKKLKEEGFLDPKDFQNDAPTAGEFMEFMERFPEVRAHGYAIGGKRYDSRVTIEGLHYEGIMSNELIGVLINELREADEFELDPEKGFRVWWD